MKYLNFDHQWKKISPRNWTFVGNLILVSLLILLSSCQNFSPKDPQVSSTDAKTKQTIPTLENFDLAAEEWQTMEGEGITLSLPKSYRGGNPLRDLTEIESAISQLDENYEKRLQAIKPNLDNTLLIAFDARSFEPDTLTNVNVVQQPYQKETSLEEYLSQAVKQLQSSHEIEEKTIITQNQSSLGRIVAKVTTEEGTTLQQLFYFQPQAETMRISTYSTPASEFQRRIANFERSIASLRSQVE
jgi:serine/threonine-protein kinase